MVGTACCARCPPDAPRSGSGHRVGRHPPLRGVHAGQDRLQRLARLAGPARKESPALIAAADNDQRVTRHGHQVEPRDKVLGRHVGQVRGPGCRVVHVGLDEEPWKACRPVARVCLHLGSMTLTSGDRSSAFERSRTTSNRTQCRSAGQRRGLNGSTPQFLDRPGSEAAYQGSPMLPASWGDSVGVGGPVCRLVQQPRQLLRGTHPVALGH